MDNVKAAYLRYGWITPLVCVIGVAVLALGFVVHGKTGGDLGRLSTTIMAVSAVRIHYLARADHARRTFRHLRCQQRTEPVPALPRSGDDAQ